MERLGNFHESARALASCLQNHDVSRKTDQSMIEAAECMFHKLLREASDDLERVTPRLRESFCAETTQNKRRSSRSETPSEKLCSRSETLIGKPRFRTEMPDEKCVWQTSTDGTPMSQSSIESLEEVVEGDPRIEFKMLPCTTTTPNPLFTEAEQQGKTRKFPDVHWTWIKCRQAVS